MRPFAPVVSASDVRACRDAFRAGNAISADEFVAGYLGHDERSRTALETALRALSARHGAAFFVNGAFGSGKSHLLGVLALLCEHAGVAAFGEAHPHLAALPKQFARRFVVAFSLDDYGADAWSLESAFWREVSTQWAREFNTELPFAFENVPRSEAFASWGEALREAGFDGACVFIDELSLFLSGRDNEGVQRDAAFLQFLGERARRSPLWVFGATQKSIEHVGALPEYSLEQIRDRFSTLSLGLAHLPSLVERRLLTRLEPERIASLCRDTFAELARAQPELEFGPDEWERWYPFHPGALLLLESVAARFLSRTRSAALFCVGEVERLLATNAPATARIGTNALWDYARPELDRHAELKALDGAWEAWRELLPELAPNEVARPLLETLMRGLLLCRVAGRAPTVAGLCHATGFDAGLPGDANYLYARGLLETLRVRGPFVAVERGAQPHLDRYAVDLGTRAGEMARRMIGNLRNDLPGSDARVRDFAKRCGAMAGLPIGDGSLEVLWRNMGRRVGVVVWDGHASLGTLSNRAAALLEPGVPEDALLLLCPPFGDRESARRAYDEACSHAEPRARGAVMLWLPRAPASDEVELAREGAASHLLEADPALNDNKRGRAVLSHLREAAPARDAALSRVCARLLREGELSTGAGLFADAGELLSGDAFAEWLERIIAFALPSAFPRWEEIAPRARVLSPSVCDALSLELLRRPPDAPFFAPSHERAVRAVCEPLGLALAEAGRWRIASGRDELKTTLRAQLGESDTLARLQAHLAKSEWGLPRELSDLLICGMLRGGELSALDARGEIVSATAIGMPLSRGVRTLQPGAQLTQSAWPLVRTVFDALQLSIADAPSFAAQETARATLLRWRDEAQAESELAWARLTQLRRALNDEGDWSQMTSARDNCERWLNSLSAPGTAAQTLQNAAETFPDARESVFAWRATGERLEASHAVLLHGANLLRAADLRVPPSLLEARDALLPRLASGESVLHDDALLHELEAWRENYAREYLAWHSTQHDGARFLSYARLASSDALRALAQLETVQGRTWGLGAVLREVLRDESAKRCGRDGSLRLDAPVCDACQLRFGERLRLRDPRELEAEFANAFATLRRVLSAPDVGNALSRDDAGFAWLEWRDSPSNATANPLQDGRELLSLLDETGHGALERALLPRVQHKRSLADLNHVLRECQTRRECETAFRAWLDNGELWGETDEIIWSDAPDEP